jgi:hypothetical protein
MSRILCSIAFVLGLMVGMAIAILTYLLILSPHSPSTRPTGRLRGYISGVGSGDDSSDENGNQNDEESGLIQSNSSSPNGEPSPLFIPWARDAGVN